MQDEAHQFEMRRGEILNENISIQKAISRNSFFDRGAYISLIITVALLMVIGVSSIAFSWSWHPIWVVTFFMLIGTVICFVISADRRVVQQVRIEIYRENRSRLMQDFS